MLKYLESANSDLGKLRRVNEELRSQNEKLTQKVRLSKNKIDQQSVVQVLQGETEAEEKNKTRFELKQAQQGLHDLSIQLMNKEEELNISYRDRDQLQLELSKYSGLLDQREVLIDDMKTQYETELNDCESRLRQT